MMHKMHHREIVNSSMKRIYEISPQNVVYGGIIHELRIKLTCDANFTINMQWSEQAK